MDEFKKQNTKWLQEHTFNKPPSKDVHNPIKEGIKSGFRFVKLFWALIVIAIIFFILIRWGHHWGIEINW